MLHIARQGRPFMMNVQSNEVTQHRMDLYRRTLRERLGRGDGGAQRGSVLGVAQRVRRGDGCGGGAHRHPGVRGDARSARRCASAFMRNRVWIVPMPAGDLPAARLVVEHADLRLAGDGGRGIGEVDEIGVGGVIMQFRLGPMATTMWRRA